MTPWIYELSIKKTFIQISSTVYMFPWIVDADAAILNSIYFKNIYLHMFYKDDVLTTMQFSMLISVYIGQVREISIFDL